MWLGAATLLTVAAVLIAFRPARPRGEVRMSALLSWRGRVSQLVGMRRQKQAIDAATLLDLTAALLNAGVGVESALDRLARTVSGAEALQQVHRAIVAGIAWEHALGQVEGYPELRSYCEHMGFAYATGAPSAQMLQAAATQARAEQRRDAETKAEELGVKMMLPLGLCFLPAFILLGVIPVVIGMLPEDLPL